MAEVAYQFTEVQTENTQKQRCSTTVQALIVNNMKKKIEMEKPAP